jgi:hypothetical protein
MRKRLTVLVGFLATFGALYMAPGSLPSDTTTAQPVTAKASPDHAATSRQYGYCQTYGCIDLPQSGYCPSGYYRFWSTACCCPINRTQAGEVAGLDTRRRLDRASFLSGSMPDIPLTAHGIRCGS